MWRERGLVVGVLAVSCWACVADEHVPGPFGSSTESLLVVDSAEFRAYFGGPDFDADVILADGQAEFVFDGVRVPVDELDGGDHEIDLAEPSGWVVMHNFIYAADDSTRWYLLALGAGTPGLSGQVTVRGTREPASVTVGYELRFDGLYELPGFEEVPEVHIGWTNIAPGTPTDVRYVDGF